MRKCNHPARSEESPSLTVSTDVCRIPIHVNLLWWVTSVFAIPSARGDIAPAVVIYGKPARNAKNECRYDTGDGALEHKYRPVDFGHCERAQTGEAN